MSSFTFNANPVDDSNKPTVTSNSVRNQSTESNQEPTGDPKDNLPPTMPGLATNGSANSANIAAMTRNKQSYPILTYLNVFPESDSTERKISMCDSIEEVVGPCQSLEREPLFSGKYLELSKYHFKDASGKVQTAEGNN